MKNITVKVYPSKSKLKKENQLAWKLAEVASDKASLSEKAIEMVINRIIDNSSVAIASLNRKSVITARQMAITHPRKKGATIFGIISKKLFKMAVFYLFALPWLENYWVSFYTRKRIW